MAQRRMSSLAGPFELMMPKALDANTITETLNRMFPSLQLIPTDIQKPTVSILLEKAVIYILHIFCDILNQFVLY